MALRFALAALVAIAKAQDDIRLFPRQVQLSTGPQILSAEQAQSIVDVVTAAGADPSKSVMSLTTSSGQRLIVRTSGDQLVKKWTAPSNQAGDEVLQMLQSARIDVPGLTSPLRRRSFSFLHAARRTETMGKRHLGRQRIEAGGLVAAKPPRDRGSPTVPAKAALSSTQPTVVNAVQNGQASAASNDGSAAVDGLDAFAQSSGSGASVSDGANSAFLSGQGTVAASGSTPGGLVVAVLGSSDAAQPTMTRNFNVLVGGVNGLQYSPNQIEAMPGDTISFVFGSKNHTLTQSTFAMPCEAMDGGANSGFLASSNSLDTTDTSGSPVVQYTVVDTAPRWFFCAQGDHCSKGMVFAVNAIANKSFTSFAKSASAWQQGNLVVGTASASTAAGNATDWPVGPLPIASVDASAPVPIPGNNVTGSTAVTSFNTTVANIATSSSTGCLPSDGLQAVDNEGGCFLLLGPDAAGNAATDAPSAIASMMLPKP